MLWNSLYHEFDGRARRLPGDLFVQPTELDTIDRETYALEPTNPARTKS